MHVILVHEQMCHYSDEPVVVSYMSMANEEDVSVVAVSFRGLVDWLVSLQHCSMHTNIWHGSVSRCSRQLHCKSHCRWGVVS